MRSLKAVSEPYGKLLNGDEHSAASSPTLQVGPASPDQLTMASSTAPPLHLICRLVLHCQTYVQHRASHRLLFTYTAGWSPIAGPVPHGLSSCAATSCLSTLRRTLVFTAIPAAPHKGSGDISAYRTAAVRSASKSDFISSGYSIKTPILSVRN